MRRCIVLFILYCFLPKFAIAQSTAVTGKVSDEYGDGMPGVSIIEKGTTNGTITDLDGNYRLEIKQSPTVLVVSMVGMASQEKIASYGGKVDVLLKEDVFQLEQVVVTGYTTQRKADLTGAVSVVNVSDMMQAAENNPMKALQGRVAGMSITSDGSPSGAATIRIRGIGTMNDKDPLYIIDGVPTKGGMHELNSNDIETIQVLRDASAASIYGSRAANGVIVITTKQGKEGKARVSFDAYLTAGWYGQVTEMMNTKQYGQALWQAYVNSGSNPNDNNLGYLYDYTYSDYGIPVMTGMSVPKYIDGKYGTNTMLSADTDWFDEITRTGLMQSYNVSVSNGTQNGNYFFSAGYLDNQGTIKESYFKRISARMNSSYKLLDNKVTIGENFSVNKTSELQAPGGVLELAVMSLPIMPVKKTDGDWASVTASMNDRDNPVRLIDANKDNPYSYWRLFGNAFVDIEPIRNLHLKSSFGVDYSNYYKRSLLYSFTGRLGSDLNSSKMEQTHGTKWIWSNTASYDLTVGKNRMDFLAGIEMNKQEDLNFSAEKRTYTLENPDYMWPSQGTGEAFAFGGGTGYSLLSYFGKANYTYDNRYLASVTLRHDGSSRFGKNNRFATFPAFSAGWRISEEAFMTHTREVVSDLKLRVGWGQTGNQEIDNLANRTILIANYIGDTGAGINSGTAYDIAGNNTGLLPSGYQLTQRGNDNIKWETTTQTNIGIDFGLFNQSVYGSWEYYLKETKDILIQPPYLGAIGEGGDQWVNGASMENKGMEFSLGYRGKTSFGMQFDLSGNISGYRNKITKLPESVVNNYGGNGTTDNILGRPIDSYYRYVADGLFRTQEEVDSYVEQVGKGLGRIRFRNLNDDDKIDEQDRTWVGNPHPDFEYGWNISLAWKGFDLSAFFQGVYGNMVINNMKKYTDFWAVAELGMNKGTRLLDAWSPDNPQSDIPAISLSDENNEKRESSYYVEPGSYLKLRNLQVGYSLPNHLLQQAKLEKVRFYISGQNLMTLKSKNFTGLDPENPSLAYPLSTTLTIGVNLAF